ncbi:MAG TPA: hypothetical protein VG929_02455 [Actinomycetota bacterium]|nr:hypothetical protein [Actinomycetota bacterium]
MKRSSYGGEPMNIGFLDRHDAVTYHPAGEHVATSGVAEDGTYGLYLATNIGGEPRLVARGEAARFITNLDFSEDGRWLYYTARHGARDWHLHRLLLGENAKLETLAKAEKNFQYTVSPFNADMLAWFVAGDCAAGQNGTFEVRLRGHSEGPEMRRGQRFDRRNIHVVGWLRSAKLVVRAATTGCSTANPGDVYVLSTNEAPRLIHKENYGSVSVRIPMPPPPPPPGEEQEVVA